MFNPDVDIPDLPGRVILVTDGSLASVNKAAKQTVSSTDRLDLLFCNAGILGAPPGSDAYEVHFGVNHLRHGLLIKHHLSTLLNTATYQTDVRVVIASSDEYRFHASEGIILRDLRTTQLNLSIFSSLGGKDSWRRYARSKLANLLYTVELALRFPTIKFVAVLPGVCDTPMTPGWIKATAISRKPLAPGGLKTPKEGSLSQLWPGTANEVASGD
ncbi:uncharacterized protein RCO7_04251 [Rhynchosporium graminicola]|uniref:Uncharacterized protein n=1 Tax=Rhynchosporium graminicola TaxID=2792576 RepID=A0A1E1LRF6_9HELO|nr:uncharacterized protein RCO7_04251 [Rhynchosporium commune]